jgi:centromere protein C
MIAEDMPIGVSRTEAEGMVASKAAQAFNIESSGRGKGNYVGYIVGNLVLPPQGIKDAESVGPCSQTYTVCQCQPGTLELAYADPELEEGSLVRESSERFFLSPGDLFRVPPGNTYRLENLSFTTHCVLSWTIIKPPRLP